MHRIVKRRKKRRQRIIKKYMSMAFAVCTVLVCLMGVSRMVGKIVELGNTVIYHREKGVMERSEKSVENESFVPVQGLSQEGIPTGCESVSTVAVLQYLGIAITPDEFIEEYLPCERFWRENGKVYGANPHEYFAGNPYETSSLGCFSEVIVKALDNMKQQNFAGMKELQVRNVTGKSLDHLENNFLSNQVPVILWVTMGMGPSYEGMKYFLKDESQYTWRAQEHCMVLCGFDEQSYYLMDPLAGGKIVKYDKKLVEQRYEEMGREAVVVYRKK